MRRALVVNGTLVALAVGTFGVVWATRDAPTTSQVSARKNQLFPELALAEVRSLLFTKGGQTLALVRDGSEFEIVKPWQERADVATVNKWLTAADMATVERPADEVSAEHAGFGPAAYRATIDLAGSTLKLTLGGPAPTPTGARYARVEIRGRTRTCVVRGSVAAELEIAFDDFREARLLEYGKRELGRVTLRRAAGAVELEQREHGAFFVRVGESWELAGPEAVRLVTEQLARLSSEEFVEPDRARSALGSAPVRLELQPKDSAAAPVTISLGGHCPNDQQRAVLLREQPGRSPRAACIAASLPASLDLEPEAFRLRGPFAAQADEIEELTITRGAQKLDLARKDRAFVLRAPSHSEVSLELGNQRLQAILRAQGELGPSDAVATADGEIRIQVAGGDEASHREERVLLGKPRADKSVCFKRLTDDVTRCVPSELAQSLEPDASPLRSSAVLQFAPSELERLSVRTGEFEQRVARQSDGNYRLEAPAGFAHDAARVTDAVQRLGTLEVRSWVAAHAQPAFGLEHPSLRVELKLAGRPEPARLSVGAKAPGGYYARLDPDPAVFVLGAELYDTLAEPLIERSLCPFSESELGPITYRSRAQSPRVADGKLREALLSLRASSVRHLGSARPGEGFDAPALSVEYASLAGTRVRLTIGLCDPGDAPRCYARRDDVDATFTLQGDIARTFRDLIR